MTLDQIAEQYRTIQADLQKYDADTKQAYRELAGRQLEVEQLVAMHRPTSGRPAIQSAGAEAIRLLEDDSAFASLRSGTPGSVRIDMETPIRAALTTEGWGGSDDTSVPGYPERREAYVVQPIPALTLLDVLPSRTTTRDSVEFVQLTADGDAGEQVEQGAEKAETNISGTLRQALITTVAVHTTVARQTLDDQTALQRAIDTLLRQQVRAKYERIIALGGTGSESSSRVDGLLEQSVVYIPTISTEPQDVLGEAATAMLMGGYRPSVIVLHPHRWHSIRTLRAAPESSDGPGPYVLSLPTSPVGPSLWSVTVALSRHVGANEGWLLDTQHIDVLDRQAVSVMVSIHHGDNFTRNRATLLAELRGGLEVRDVLAVRRVQFGSDYSLPS